MTRTERDLVKGGAVFAITTVALDVHSVGDLRHGDAVVAAAHGDDPRVALDVAGDSPRGSAARVVPHDW